MSETNDPNLIGIAWHATVCSNPLLAYSLSQRMTTAASRAVLGAHEIGHNFGATHNCAGTIMNAYLSGSALTFCPYSRAEIGSYLEVGSSCLTQSCKPVISPAGVTVPAAGGAGAVDVMTGASCAWTAKSNVPWVVIKSGASGSGNKTVGYTVAANPYAVPRTGTLTVAGRTHTVTQSPRLGVQSVTLTPSVVAGGKKISGKVVLSGPTNGVTVTLSDSLAATTVPATLFIPAGATSMAFSVTTVVTPTAQSGILTASYDGTTATAPLTVRPAVLNSLKLSPADVMGSKGVTAFVSLDGPAPAAGAVVTLSDALPATTTPASVTIPSGATSKTFVIPTVYVTAKQTGSVTARYAGVTIVSPLTVRPTAVSAVVLAPDSAVGGTAMQGKVVLEAPAPRDIPVTLTETLAGASVPASVTVPAGAVSQSFTVTTLAVSAPQDGVLTATAPGGGRSVPFTVERNPVRCPTLSFGALQTYPAVYGEALAVADFNHDGNLDLAVLGVYKIGILLGTGAGGFGAPIVISTGMLTTYDLAVGDFNQDGNRDLVITAGDKLGVMLGDGKGGFTPPAYFLSGDYNQNRRVVVGDINGDGRQDLLTPGAWITYALLGDGLGRFGKPVTVTSGHTTDIVVGDFNADGNADIVQASDYTTGYITLGAGAGVMGSPAAVTGSGQYSASQVAAGDFNKDGKQDLAFSRYNDGLYVMLGDGTGAYAPPVLYTGGGGDHELLARDLNGDRIEDLVVAQEDFTIAIFQADGLGKFKAPFKSVAVSRLPSSISLPELDIVAGDFNHDGRLDIAATNQADSAISVLLGTCK